MNWKTLQLILILLNLKVKLNIFDKRSIGKLMNVINSSSVRRLFAFREFSSFFEKKGKGHIGKFPGVPVGQSASGTGFFSLKRNVILQLIFRIRHHKHVV